MTASLSLDEVCARLQASHPQNLPIPDGLREALQEVGVVYAEAEAFLKAYRYRVFDFVYDAQSGLSLAEYRAKHVGLLAALYRYRSGQSGSAFDDSDEFVLKGYGLFKSRAGNYIYHGEGYKAPPEFWPIARDLRILP